MVEKKAVEITQACAKAANKLSNDQWQALIGLHRTLLHEHHDFFLASQHPTASPALRRLAKKYAMPARMWRHGIHSFLELLRQQLPGSLEHMLAFVYIAYSMMALLMESVPRFLETWIECLGDLARYRMAIVEVDLRDREIWSKIARTWYNRAADLSPDVGRIQHHLAVLARPNIVQQLFYYSKALVSIKPFENARESIMLLFNPLLDTEDPSYDKYRATEASFVSAFAFLFKRGSLQKYQLHIETFQQGLSDHITRAAAEWKTQGPEVAASIIAGVLDFGKPENPVWTMYRQHIAAIESRKSSDETMEQGQIDAEDVSIRDLLFEEFWSDVDAKAPVLARAPTWIPAEVGLGSSQAVSIYVLEMLRSAVATNAGKIGDRNVVPFMNFILGFLWSLARIGGPLIYLEAHIPWSNIVLFLNMLGRSGVSERVTAVTFPQSTSGTGRQLPEDIPARGAVWAPDIFPPDFFRNTVADEDERSLELPSHTAPRYERCLWFGVRLASLNRYIRYNVSTKQFSLSNYAMALEQGGRGESHQPGPTQSHTAAEKPHLLQDDTGDVEMTDEQASGSSPLEADSDYVMIDRGSMVRI
ncbi:uncharacterized protein HMPREF1541_08999 [Cyphellophora europaea CBS 101466]|uniref:DNA/RNA-binding domain-containing protein n=1 Tax=Cyphellophora europaea (strain CBS 101466) TaxID=1220924 RepID=W2RJR7_CYPE1|nr:uncharacterized protein HMPREF1541_08999 [Cyphellophora europaea CBS 101466]ETN36721.1 hypothetical protein HMPREF1541_08999 [Cyphellophora europaea CBS 101466]